MALGKQYSKSVVFIAGRGQDQVEARLRGTGFLAGFRSTVNPNQGRVYVVTAAHVVRPMDATYVRLNTSDGSVAECEIDEWIFHPIEDIAVARMPVPYSDFDFYAVDASEFAGTAEVEKSFQPGADVYVAGLLGQVPSMGAQNMPMVRSGSVGALDQEGIPMRLPDETLIKARGHLIDCQSFGGFSGSPCFVRYISGKGETEHLGLTYPVESTLLLGMVGGHFDLKASVSMPDQQGNLEVPVAAGVAVVYSAESIREVLDEDLFVAEREQLDQDLVDQADKD
jgi:hypothetical protein